MPKRKKPFLSEKDKKAISKRLDSGDLKVNSMEYKLLCVKQYDQDPLGFAQKFLTEHVLDPVNKEPTKSPAFHQDLIDLYQEHNRVVVAAPRGHAKTTVTSFFYVLYCLLFEHKRNIVIVSQTEKMASRFLRRLKDELEFNKKLIWLFGPQKTEKWSETEFKTQNGCSVFAIGRGGQLRGLLTGATRPDLIVLDDIEDDEQVLSQMRRGDLESWFNSTVLPSVTPKIGQIIFIGTVLHMDSQLNRMLDPNLYTDFERARYAAIDESGKVLWPERFSKKELLSIKENYIRRDQLSRFFMEYQNEPTPEEAAVFKPEYFQYFEDLPESHKLHTEIYVDPGGGGASKGADPTAMVVVSVDDKNNFFINDYVNDKMGTDTKKFANELFRLNALYKPNRIVIEKTVASNMIKASLEQEMRTRNVFLNIEYISPTRGVGGGRRGDMSEGKYQRIATMQAAFKVGAIKMRPWMTELQEQLLRFPRAKHDDLADALAYAWMFFERRCEVDERKDEGDYLFGKRQEHTYVPLYPEIGL
jgi:predicted phage terminase large subunit-like protein